MEAPPKRLGADSLLGEEDGDTIYAGSGDYVDGYESVTTGVDLDRLYVTDVASIRFDPFLPENGVVTFDDGSTLSFFNIEEVYADGVRVLPPDFIVEGTGGDDLIDAGYSGDPEGDRIDASDNQSGSNADVVVAGDGNDTVLSGADHDSVDAGTGDDLVDGGAGRDTLLGFDGNDTLLGGDGDDSLFGFEDDDSLSGGADRDMVDGDEGDDTLSGGLGEDTLVGDAGNDVLFGDEDNDSLFDSGGDNQAFGGTGNDQIFVGSGQDSLYGGEGNDTLVGDAGDDLLVGGADADTLYGGDDRDTILGGTAGDVVDGGEGGDDDDVLDLRAYRHSGTTVRYDNNDPGSESGEVDFLDAAGLVTGTLRFSNIERVVACFTPGSLILTEMGELPVEQLQVGDRVLTRDNGYQPVRWMARRDLTQAELRATAAFNPVRIAKGALGNGRPERDLIVSPQHRILIAGPQAELLFGEHEVLVAATHMVGSSGVSRIFPAGTSYLHFMCDTHEIVRSDGAWTESFQPGAQTMAGLASPQRDELLALFPDVLHGARYQSARLSLKAREAAVLLSA